MGVEKRLRDISSSEKAFNEDVRVYQEALNKAGHQYNLKYSIPDTEQELCVPRNDPLHSLVGHQEVLTLGVHGPEVNERENDPLSFLDISQDLIQTGQGPPRLLGPVQAVNESRNDHYNSLGPHNNYETNSNQEASSIRSKKRKNRSRNIIWFNPPYDHAIKTNVGKIFLSLVEKHFGRNKDLKKIFNKNNIKVSYSCGRNIKQDIQSHN